ncbi:MAG: ABC transporter permease [Bacteroidales bacterium]
MNKIFLIISREFFTRIKKPSFVLMSLFLPLVMTSVFVIPLWLQKMDAQEVKHIAVVDETNIFASTLKNNENYNFTILDDTDLDQAKELYNEGNFYAVLFIPKNVLNSRIVQLFSDTKVDIGLKTYTQKVLENDITSLKLLKKHVHADTLKAAQSPIIVKDFRWKAREENSASNIDTKIKIALMFAIIIFMFIFMYGSQVIRGVIEEKSSRIIEVLCSSVKPVEIMFGKIIGIAGAGMVQFILLLAFTFVFITASQYIFFAESFIPTIEHQTPSLESGGMMTGIPASNAGAAIRFTFDVFSQISEVNWVLMSITFIFYFILGYILYGTIYASIGAMSENTTDIQQFILPVTLPLFVSLFMLEIVISNPTGAVSLWLSFIPFTSPVIMMARLPFGVPIWHVVMSLLILIVSVLISIYISSKIYRTAILLYGKRITLKEIITWLF